MNKNGFTLIELLIVITILAILAGGAIPYVQQYVEDSRISRAKADLEEIKKALVRYETDQGIPYTTNNIDKLVGPYLMKAMSDPWGSPYRIDSDMSACYSFGPNSSDDSGSGDDVVRDFRPPLALSKVYWEDSNQNAAPDTGDVLVLKFTRPLRRNAGDGPVLTVAADDLIYTDNLGVVAGNPANDYTAISFSNFDMVVRLTLDYGANPPFKAGKYFISIKPSSAIVDMNGTLCKSGQEMLIKALNN